MDATKEKTKGDEGQRRNKYRITLTCQNLKNVEKVSNELIRKAKEIEGVKVTGPVRMPVKTLRIGTRKSPCGEGTNTYDRWELRIYKRVIDLTCSNDDMKSITALKIDPGVEVELNMITGADEE